LDVFRCSTGTATGTEDDDVLVGALRGHADDRQHQSRWEPSRDEPSVWAYPTRFG